MLKMKNVNLNKTIKINCPICLCKIKTITAVGICVQKFYFNCISEWSKIHNTCPVCRSKYEIIKFKKFKKRNFYKFISLYDLRNS